MRTTLLIVVVLSLASHCALGATPRAEHAGVCADCDRFGDMMVQLSRDAYPLDTADAQDADHELCTRDDVSLEFRDACHRVVDAIGLKHVPEVHAKDPLAMGDVLVSTLLGGVTEAKEAGALGLNMHPETALLTDAGAAGQNARSQVALATKQQVMQHQKFLGGVGKAIGGGLKSIGGAAMDALSIGLKIMLMKAMMNRLASNAETTSTSHAMKFQEYARSPTCLDEDDAMCKTNHLINGMSYLTGATAQPLGGIAGGTMAIMMMSMGGI